QRVVWLGTRFPAASLAQLGRAECDRRPNRVRPEVLRDGVDRARVRRRARPLPPRDFGLHSGEALGQGPKIHNRGNYPPRSAETIRGAGKARWRWWLGFGGSGDALPTLEVRDRSGQQTANLLRRELAVPQA